MGCRFTSKPGPLQRSDQIQTEIYLNEMKCVTAISNEDSGVQESRPRVEARSAEQGGPQGWGSGGVTPGKILKFETQFGAIWCILSRN